MLVRLKIMPYEKWPTFATKGDSGSVVFDRKGDAVGLITQEWPRWNFSVASPIDEECNDLGVSLLGSKVSQANSACDDKIGDICI
jgi:hypothetical protein